MTDRGSEPSTPSSTAARTLFRHGHATHPDWRTAVELALAQVEAQARDQRYCVRPTLGFFYVTSVLAEHFSEIATQLKVRTAVIDWIGTVGHAICAAGAEYADEPAVSLMMAELPSGSSAVFSGRSRPPDNLARTPSGAAAAHTAIVHTDPSSEDLPDLIRDMAGKTAATRVIGGIASGRAEDLPHFANHTMSGGLSGVMLGADVPLLARVTQGCRALGPAHRIDQCKQQFIEQLDGQPALDVLLAELGVDETVRQSRDGQALLRALPSARLKNGLLVALSEPNRRDPAPINVTQPGDGLGNALVRNIIGIDPQSRLIAVAAQAEAGMHAVFCTRDAAAARADLIRICTELREEIESLGATIRGGLFISCIARGMQLFDGPSVELGIVAEQLGEFPLTGFYANGEILGDKLYGYTGILALFV